MSRLIVQVLVLKDIAPDRQHTDVCDGCLCVVKRREDRASFWTLNGYHGLWGKYCSECFDRMDCTGGTPKDPAYLQLLQERNGYRTAFYRRLREGALGPKHSLVDWPQLNPRRFNKGKMPAMFTGVRIA